MQTTTQPSPPPSPTLRPAGRTPAPWEETYLDTLADSGQKAKAARLAGINLRHVIRRRNQDSAFARLELEAIEASWEIVESEAIRRAVEGVEVSTPGRNGQIVTRIIYSDTLLLKLLQRYVWSKPLPKASTDLTFDTAADRRAALEKAKANMAESHKRVLGGPDYMKPQPPNSPPPNSPPPKALTDLTFDTAADRRAALEKAQAEIAESHKRVLQYQPPNSPPAKIPPP